MQLKVERTETGIKTEDETSLLDTELESQLGEEKWT